VNKGPVWVLENVVLALHNRQLAEHGGAEGIRDQGLLESALNAPRNKYLYEKSSTEELAASYAFSLVKNHPFIDDNKRTAYVCMRLFLQLNGMDIIATSEEKVFVMFDLASGKIDQNRFHEWIKEHS